MAKAEWRGVVIAESEAYEVVEGNVYFPRASVRSAPAISLRVLTAGSGAARAWDDGSGSLADLVQDFGRVLA